MQESFYHGHEGDDRREFAQIQVVNTNEQLYLPPLIRAFTDFYNNMNAELNVIREDISRRQERIRSINKEMLRRLRNH